MATDAPDRTTVNMENVTLDSETLWMTRIQLIYGLPSLSLMVYCILLIAIGKRYKRSSFYKLVLFDLITNLLVYLNTWLAIRIEMHPSLVFILKFIEMYFPGVITWLKYFPYWFFHMHFWTAALLTFHRLTSIVYPYQYENNWNRFFPVIVIVVAIMSHLPKYIWKGYLYEVYIVDGTLTCYIFPRSLDTAINVVAFFSLTYFAINLADGLAVAFYAAKKIESATSSKTNIKRKLTWIALVYSMCYTCEVVWSVVNSANGFFHFMPNWWYSVNNNLLVFASDFFTLSLPYILLGFDTNVKKDTFFWKRRNDSNQGTIVVVSQHSH